MKVDILSALVTTLEHARALQIVRKVCTNAAKKGAVRHILLSVPTSKELD